MKILAGILIAIIVCLVMVIISCCVVSYKLNKLEEEKENEGDS